MNIILLILVINAVFWGAIIGADRLADKFPNSKVSRFIRKHLITDQDLEP
jgi:hypothetical protein